MSGRKIGVLGGTFDPVHNGHLAIADEVLARLGLDGVVFVPAGQPWWKPDRQITPAHHRVAMVRLAIADRTRLSISTGEIDRGGPSYTIDTIAEMHAARGPGDEFCLIIGRDVLPEIRLWKEPQRLLEMVNIVAVPRPGYPNPDVSALDAKLPGLARHLTLLDTPEVDISATDIRKRVRNGLPVDHLVPPAVARYIEQEGLYKQH